MGPLTQIGLQLLVRYALRHLFSAVTGVTSLAGLDPLTELGHPLLCLQQPHLFSVVTCCDIPFLRQALAADAMFTTAAFFLSSHFCDIPYLG